MNILQLISSGGYYGAENVVVALSESLERNNCKSIIGVFQHNPQQNEDLTGQAQRRGLTVLPIPCRGRWDRQTIGAIRGILVSRKIDILHTHGYKPDIYGYLASRRLAVPRVATCHLWTRNTRAVRAYEFLDSLVLRRFDAVVAVSGTVRDSLRRSGIPSAGIRVIDNGIDLHHFSQGCRNSVSDESGCHRTLVVGTVGRLVPQKGLEYLLRSAREVLAECPGVAFEIVGAGPDREKLEHTAHELGIQQSVRFSGHCTDMPNAYAAMDVYVQSSIDEGMPMAILEAMASKKPVIATSVGAVPRIVISGKTGILVPPNDVQALKSAILRLLRDPGLRSQLGAAGTALVQRNHSHNAMAKNYLDLYEQVASTERKGLSEAPSRKALAKLPSL